MWYNEGEVASNASGRGKEWRLPASRVGTRPLPPLPGVTARPLLKERCIRILSRERSRVMRAGEGKSGCCQQSVWRRIVHDSLDSAAAPCDSASRSSFDSDGTLGPCSSACSAEAAAKSMTEKKKKKKKVKIEEQQGLFFFPDRLGLIIPLVRSVHFDRLFFAPPPSSAHSPLPSVCV